MISPWGINIKQFYSNDLFRDYIFDFRNVMEFYEYDYRNIENYRKRIFDIKADYDEKNRIKIYDILSCEVSVIWTSVGGLKEIVEHGRSGFIFDPEDIGSMTEAAVKILTSEDIRAKMGVEARKRAKLFDSRLIVPQYLKYYKKILNTE